MKPQIDCLIQQVRNSGVTRYRLTLKFSGVFDTPHTILNELNK